MCRENHQALTEKAPREVISHAHLLLLFLKNLYPDLLKSLLNIKVFLPRLCNSASRNCICKVPVHVYHCCGDNSTVEYKQSPCFFSLSPTTPTCRSDLGSRRPPRPPLPISSPWLSPSGKRERYCAVGSMISPEGG